MKFIEAKQQFIASWGAFGTQPHNGADPCLVTYKF
jgi:hypothetical protein